MLRRIRHQAILLDRFWDSVRSDPQRRSLPPAGLNPEIADLAVRLSAESRAMAPTAAFRTELRERLEAAAQTSRQHSVVLPDPSAGLSPHRAASLPESDVPITLPHPAAEWMRFAAAILAFVLIGALLVALLRDTDDDGMLGTSATATLTPEQDLSQSILPPGASIPIELNGGRPGWGLTLGAGSIWVGTVTDEGSTIVRAAETGKLGGRIQATIPLTGRVWDVAYGHGAVWATVIGDSLTGEGSALVRIDPATNEITHSIPVGAQPTNILINDTAVWVTDLAQSTIWRVDPETNTVVATIELGDSGNGVGAVLVDSGDELSALLPGATGQVEFLRIDQTTNSVATRSTLPESEEMIGVVAATSGTFWIGTMTNRLIRFDVWTGEIVDRIVLPGQPRAILADDDYLWVATTGFSPQTGQRIDAWRNVLVLIDAPSGRVHTITDLHEIVPFALAVGEQRGTERIWISLASEADPQARLRGEMRPSEITFDTVPPTATAEGVVATADASPPATPSPTREPATSTPGPTPTIPIDATPAGEIVATYEFVGGLGPPVWGAGALWVPNFTAGVIERIDGTTGETTRVEISRPGEAIDGVWVVLAVDDSAVWSSDNAANELVRIDPYTFEIVARIHLGDLTPFPASIETMAVGEGAVWVILDDQEIVVRIDPATNTVAAVIDAPGAKSIVAGLGAVWVQNIWTAEILRIDPATNEVVATIPTGPNQFTILSMAIGGGWLWVEGGLGNIHQIDPATNAIVASMSANLGFEPGHLAVDAGHLAADDSAAWAVYEIPSRVVRFNPVTHETRTLDITVPNGVAVGGGSVWVTTAAGSPNTVVRITPAP